MSGKAPQTVLIADDDFDTRSIVRALLEHAGRRVLEALDGEECLRVAREQHPDVLVLDLSLPVLDGWATAAALRQEPATRALPIVAVSGMAFPAEQARALAAGCDRVLTKPVSPMVLLRVIEEMVGSGGGGR